MNSKRAKSLAKGDSLFLAIGAFGATLSGLMYPGWGVVFAYMIEVLYKPVFKCESIEDLQILMSFGMDMSMYETCQDYFDDTADEMRELSINITYGWIGLMAIAIVGNGLLYYGFGKSSEKINKRVRDKAFNSLIRQEIGYFDLKNVGSITSELQDDAAMIHSFSGEPIRTAVMNASSLLVGLVVSFVYMWPFALLVLVVLPAMGFGAAMEMKMYLGEDESGEAAQDEKRSSGGLVIESLLNIRTVASLTIEKMVSSEYSTLLKKENPHLIKTSFFKGVAVGLGQFCQMGGMAVMFYWGGWLLNRYSEDYSYRGFLISMFSLLFSLSGTGAAAQGLTDRGKAQVAAERIFSLIDRKSSIDPIGQGGKIL